jgi:hypothetical protein
VLILEMPEEDVAVVFGRDFDVPAHHRVSSSRLLTSSRWSGMLTQRASSPGVLRERLGANEQNSRRPPCQQRLVAPSMVL